MDNNKMGEALGSLGGGKENNEDDNDNNNNNNQNASNADADNNPDPDPTAGNDNNNHNVNNADTGDVVHHQGRENDHQNGDRAAAAQGANDFLSVHFTAQPNLLPFLPRSANLHYTSDQLMRLASGREEWSNDDIITFMKLFALFLRAGGYSEADYLDSEVDYAPRTHPAEPPARSTEFSRVHGIYRLDLKKEPHGVYIRVNLRERVVEVHTYSSTLGHTLFTDGWCFAQIRRLIAHGFGGTGPYQFQLYKSPPPPRRNRNTTAPASPGLDPTKWTIKYTQVGSSCSRASNQDCVPYLFMLMKRFIGTPNLPETDPMVRLSGHHADFQRCPTAQIREVTMQYLCRFIVVLAIHGGGAITESIFTDHSATLAIREQRDQFLESLFSRGQQPPAYSQDRRIHTAVGVYLTVSRDNATVAEDEAQQRGLQLNAARRLSIIHEPNSPGSGEGEVAAAPSPAGSATEATSNNDAVTATRATAASPVIAAPHQQNAAIEAFNIVADMDATAGAGAGDGLATGPANGGGGGVASADEDDDAPAARAPAPAAANGGGEEDDGHRSTPATENANEVQQSVATMAAAAAVAAAPAPGPQPQSPEQHKADAAGVAAEASPAPPAGTAGTGGHRVPVLGGGGSGGYPAFAAAAPAQAAVTNGLQASVNASARTEGDGDGMSPIAGGLGDGYASDENLQCSMTCQTIIKRRIIKPTAIIAMGAGHDPTHQSARMIDFLRVTGRNISHSLAPMLPTEIVGVCDDIISAYRRCFPTLWNETDPPLAPPLKAPYREAMRTAYPGNYVMFADGMVLFDLVESAFKEWIDIRRAVNLYAERAPTRVLDDGL